MEHHFSARFSGKFPGATKREQLVLFSRSDRYSKRKFVFPFLQVRELMLGETILSAKQLLKKNSEKMFALGTVSWPS